MSEEQGERIAWWAWLIPVALGLAVIGAGRWAEWQEAQAQEDLAAIARVEQTTQAQEGVTTMAAGWMVSGAGDPDANGPYLPAGTHNGATYYTNSNGWYLFHTIYEEGEAEHWELATSLGGAEAYRGANLSALPSNPWAVGLGTAPAPTVTEWFSWPSDWTQLGGGGGLGYIPARELELTEELTLHSLRAGVQGSGHFRMAIYDAADGALVMSSFAAEIDDEAAEDYTYVTLKGEVTLAPGTYWLACWTDDAGVRLGYYGLTGGLRITAGTYPAWPNPAVDGAREGGWFLTWPEAGEEPEIQSATWTLQADWSAGTGSNVDTTTRPGSVILQAE